MQDWYLKYQLTAVEGVSEVASVGGFVKQYQVTVDPDEAARLQPLHCRRQHGHRTQQRRSGRPFASNWPKRNSSCASRATSKAWTICRKSPWAWATNGVPILLRDVANVQFGPDMRRGIAELNGEGETVGGIVVVRYGANARQVIQDVKAAAGPGDEGAAAGRESTPSPTTARALIDRAVETLEEKLLEESIVVALVCLAFLLHLRSALVAIVILPIAVLIAFLVMFGQGISSNIMSLGGIAIAIGAMVDAVIIMIENAHKHLERDQGKKPHWDIIRDAASRGRADAVLFAAGHHGFVPAGVHVAGAGRPAVQAAGVHQDLFDGRGGAALHHARAGSDGLVHPRQNSDGGKESHQPPPDLALSSGD